MCLMVYTKNCADYYILICTGPVVLQRLFQVHRFVDDLFVPDFVWTLRVLYTWTKTLLVSAYILKCCELNFTYNGFSCNFLDLGINQSPRGLWCDICDKFTQPEYAVIDMMCMPHAHSNITLLSLSWALSIVSSTGS
jgi:hypothetical protein